MLAIAIKKRNEGGEWDPVSLSELAGKSFRQVLHGFAGCEVVAELTVENRRMFFCGTEPWAERMAGKGSAATFEQLSTLIKESSPELLGKTIPGFSCNGPEEVGLSPEMVELLKMIMTVFPGAEVIR